MAKPEVQIDSGGLKVRKTVTRSAGGAPQASTGVGFNDSRLARETRAAVERANKSASVLSEELTPKSVVAQIKSGKMDKSKAIDTAVAFGIVSPEDADDLTPIAALNLLENAAQLSEDSTVSIRSIARRTLRRGPMSEKEARAQKKIEASSSHHDLLTLIKEASEPEIDDKNSVDLTPDFELKLLNKINQRSQIRNSNG